MKIIIVGAGIGGLSTYHALKKHLPSSDHKSSQGPLSICVVESHGSPALQAQATGGGLGLAPNGLRAIASISPSAVQHIQDCAFPGSQMTFRNSSGKLLGTMSTGCGDRYGYEMSMLPRAIVHEALLAGIDDKDFRWGLKVTGVQDSGGQVTVEFADGTKETADLVIGADGVRSVVKDSLFKGKFQAEYDGLLGVGGFLYLHSLPTRVQKSFSTYGVTMTFGKQGFFGYSMCSPLSSASTSESDSEHTGGPPFIQWWSIYETPKIPSRSNIDYEEIKSQLLSRHGDWKTPFDEADVTVYRRLIELGCQPPQSAEVNDTLNTTVMVLPRYITPRLPYWSNANLADTPESNRGRIILLGDAAHTMPPDVGQGVSCAAEDAIVYALFLKHYLSVTETLNTDPSPFVQAAEAYEEIRKPYIHRILDFAKRNGDMKKEMGWFAQVLRDFAMRIVCRLPQSINDFIFAYDPESVVAKYLSAHS